MCWGTSPIDCTEPQVSLILGRVRTSHPLEQRRVQKHSVYRVFPHHCHDLHGDDPSAQDIMSNVPDAPLLTKSGTPIVCFPHVELEHTSSPLAPLILFAQHEQFASRLINRFLVLFPSHHCETREISHSVSQPVRHCNEAHLLVLSTLAFRLLRSLGRLYASSAAR